MNKEELVYDDIKKALNQFRREDLLNDGMGHDIDTGIGVSITIREMVKYIRQQKEIDRLNNIINELKWKPIEEYDKSNYDWVLVKYFDGDYECVPCVAEKRFGKWYSIDEKEIQFDVKYFMDMQQLDKLKESKEE